MTINGLDISLYQEQPAYGKLIDWPALKADPLNFRFIWIKCAEGTDDAGYVEGAVRQAAGAKSVQFEAVNPYHFYYFQWFSTAANRWYTLNAADQARAFRNAAQDAGMLISHPMTDIEDPFVGQFLVWSDTATANAALAFARRLNAHLKAYHEAVEFEFGVKPDIYTGAWWWDRMGVLLLANYPAECEWWGAYRFILADYVGGLDYPRGIRADQVIAWQFTSTPTPPVLGIPTGHYLPGDALDCDRWMQSEAEFLKWTGQDGGSSMAAIYKETVPQTDRAKVLTLEPYQTIKKGVTIADLGIDGVILPMGSMSNWDGSHWRTLAEPTFPGRYDLFSMAGVPVLGRFELDAGSLIAEQHGDAEFKNRAIRDNFVLPKLIDAWHIGPWTWDSIFDGQGQWRNISALILSEVKQTPYKGVLPNGYWQQLIWDYMTNHLNTLIANGQIPNIPLLMYSGGWWISQYPEMISELDNNRGWLYLQLGEWKFTSTATFPTLADIFTFRPAETFKFAYLPNGYDQRVLLHEYTGEAQKCGQIVDAAGIPTAVNLSLWQSNRTDMYTFLKYGGYIPPVDNCDELRTRVAELETLNAQMNEMIASQGELIAQLREQVALSEALNSSWQSWYAGAPKGGTS